VEVLMANKPTYKELEQKIQNLENELLNRKNIETSLLEAEQKVHSLIETTSDWIWEVDLYGNYTYASPKVKDILGYDASEIVGEQIYAFMPDEEIETSKEFFESMCQRPEPFSGRKITQIRKDGDRVIIEINGAPVYDKNGELSGFCGCDKDMTHKVMAEEFLRESEERYRNLFENTQAGVFRAALDGSEFFDVNKKFADIFGYSVEEIQTKPSPLSSNGSTDFAGMFQQLAEEKSVEDHEIEAVTKDGEKITCIASVKPFFRQGYVEGTIVDISNRKKIENALRERETELDLKNESLEEMNAALRVLLKKREEDKKELEEKVILNVQRLLIPFMDKLENSRLDERQHSYVSILRSNLEDIVTPFSRSLTSKNLKLTPAEIQISNLVKQGRPTKEIAQLLNLSTTTIETHRRNIRKKFGLNNRKQNLRTYLSALHNE
jgi:PAS domain S-box-containing protein